jgi:hypothetical protein
MAQESKIAETKVEKVTISGSELAGLFPAPPSEKVKIEYDGKFLEFEVMPLDNEVFAQIGDSLKMNNIDFEANINAIAGMKVVSDLYWPAIKVVLPKCGVNPKFINGVSTDVNTMSVNRLPLEVAIELFDKILDLSGLGKKGKEERKK